MSEANGRTGSDEIEGSAAALEPVRLAERLPELGALWIRYYPRRWPSPPAPWIDLALLALGEDGVDELRGGELERRPDDVLYLPPVSAELRPWRDHLAREARRGGVRPLAQVHPGEPAPDPCALTVVDPLPALLQDGLAKLGQVPAGSLVAWPLIPGLSDAEATWDEALALLARSGVRCAQAVVPALDPAQRRRLAEGAATGRRSSDELFHALFHRGDGTGEQGLERAFARRARRHGLEALLVRPGLSLPGRTARNRELAGLLATAGELWLRLGRSPTLGQNLFRAARFVDEAAIDVRALAREGNLGVLGWLDVASREVVMSWARNGSSPLVQELRQVYLHDEDEDAG